MKLSPTPDEWQMAQVARGKREGLDVLVRRYANPLLTFIRRMIGDLHESEELFQDVFLAVWQKRSHYDHARPFRPWLYQIALNKCRAAFRRRTLTSGNPFAAGALDVAPDPGPSPSDTALAAETQGRVAAAVARLPVQQRAVLVLRVWSDLSYAEIADALGRSEATVRSHMHHALAHLRAELKTDAYFREAPRQAGDPSCL
jgi:RNA polymerase sigma-70 factor, ECF subfamily